MGIGKKICGSGSGKSGGIEVPRISHCHVLWGTGLDSGSHVKKRMTKSICAYIIEARKYKPVQTERMILNGG